MTAGLRCLIEGDTEALGKLCALQKSWAADMYHRSRRFQPQTDSQEKFMRAFGGIWEDNLIRADLESRLVERHSGEIVRALRRLALSRAFGRISAALAAGCSSETEEEVLLHLTGENLLKSILEQEWRYGKKAGPAWLVEADDATRSVFDKRQHELRRLLRRYLRFVPGKTDRALLAWTWNSRNLILVLHFYRLQFSA